MRKERLSVLLIDDDKRLLQSTQKLLTKKYRWSCNTASSGKEGLQRLEEMSGDVDVVVVDMSMPEMNGHATIKAICRKWPHLCVVVLTGSDTYNDIDEAIVAVGEGVDDYLTKPIKADDLIFRLRLAYESRQRIVVRSIELQPEYRPAGMAILEHFGAILQKRYPTDSVKVTIKQKNLEIRLEVDTPGGETQSKVEALLEDYRRVISGEMQPKEFTSDSTEIGELEILLRLVEGLIEQYQEIHQLDNANIERLRILLSAALQAHSRAPGHQPSEPSESSSLETVPQVAEKQARLVVGFVALVLFVAFGVLLYVYLGKADWGQIEKWTFYATMLISAATSVWLILPFPKGWLIQWVIKVL